MIFLDTHVVVWIYGGLIEKLTPKAIQLIERHDLKINPMVLLEMQYLYEIKRINEPASVIFEDLHLRIGLSLSQAPWQAVVKESLLLDWTRDPFDRLITAEAILTKQPLITQDENIRRYYKDAIG